MRFLKKFALVLLAVAAVLALAAWLVFKLPSFGGVPEGERVALRRPLQTNPQAPGCARAGPDQGGRVWGHLARHPHEPRVRRAGAQRPGRHHHAARALGHLQLGLPRLGRTGGAAVAAAAKQGAQLVTPRVGEKFEFGAPFENRAWYRP